MKRRETEEFSWKLFSCIIKGGGDSRRASGVLHMFYSEWLTRPSSETPSVCSGPAVRHAGDDQSGDLCETLG